MPLTGFRSLCEEKQKIIVSKDKKNPQEHRAINGKLKSVTHYQIDGVIITQGERCDFLLLDEEGRIAYYIELKGSDIEKAAKQIEVTENALKSELKGYGARYRIVVNKCNTHAIKNNSFRKYQIKWGNKLVYKTGQMIEEI